MGSAMRKFDAHSHDSGKYPSTYVLASPRNSAPANVSQMLRSRPNIAAAMESNTSNVRTWTSSEPPLIGVMRMPASAASAPPRAHEKAASRSGRPPLSCRSAGLSTTARIATPVRVLVNKRRMPTAMSTPQPRAIASWSVTKTPRNLNFAVLPKNNWSVRGTPGFQIHCASAINPSMMPIEILANAGLGTVLVRLMLEAK